MLLSDGNGKGVRHGANAFPNRLGALAHKAILDRNLGFGGNYLRRRSAYLKLRAHLLDLRGLLFEPGCELRDRCF